MNATGSVQRVVGKFALLIARLQKTDTTTDISVTENNENLAVLGWHYKVSLAWH